MKIVLGSGSKQRQDLLKMVGLKYEVVTSDVDEYSNAVNPRDYVVDLSKQKAEAVSKKLNENAIIITADTVIYHEGMIYEKPKTKEEAFEKMKNMSGKMNLAITGLTIKDMYKDKITSIATETKVYFREISDEELKWYVDSEKELLKCSGYALLGKAAMFLDKVEGDYNSLFGISPSVILEKLKELGYKISDFEFEDYGV